MEFLKIIAVCVLIAIFYCVCFAQVTARICVEYFAIREPQVFGTTSPMLLAFGWGAIGGWCIGVFVGTLLATVSRLGSRPRLAWRDLIKPLVVLLSVVSVCSLLAGIGGSFAVSSATVRLSGRIASRLPDDRHSSYVADLWAHSAAWGTAFVGGLVLCGFALHRRRQKSH